MKKNIIVEKRYINVPVSNSTPSTRVIIKTSNSQNILRYFDVSPGGEVYDFIAYHDLEEFVGQEIEFEIANDELAEKFFTALRQSDLPLGLDGVYQEKHRPQFHFSSKRGWLNDPNGLVYYNGKYHLFYQHNPFGTGWGNMHWGHAVSNDLIHWQEKGDVLCPDETGMMFSGGAVVDWHNASGLQQHEHPPILLFYTAAGNLAPVPCEDTQCMAYSVDGGETFKKYANNPVVGHIISEARDPKVIWHQESQKWVMALYRGDAEKTFNLLTSTNLLKWQIIQELAVPDGRECPEFFPIPLDGCEDNIKWIFMEANGKYLIGNFDGEKFEAEAGPFDSFGRYGKGCGYAGQIWSNTLDGRKIMLCWQQGECQAADFNQNMTLPVELSLKSFSDGMRLCAEPIKELAGLRGASWEFNNIAMKPSDNTPDEFMKIPEGNSWDIEIELADNCELIINVCGEDIALDAKAREVRMSAIKFPFPADAKEFKLRILVDRASIELFGGNGRIWYAKRKLTTPAQPVIFPYQTSGSGSLKKVKIHTINSIWE
ncbi:MAG: glycoside hydrolase family 32 protein [Victivallaceae bacterium]|nr:glycoside hydrolase family 32 protein [Victivallaceae bacterium]